MKRVTAAGTGRLNTQQLKRRTETGGASVCLPADEQTLVPPCKALTLRCDGACVTLDDHADTAAVALVLSEGWSRAQAGLAEIMRFGAALLTVSEWLDECFPVKNIPQRGCTSKGQGLKGWLEKHCPDINYNTAYGYMQAAAGLRNMLKLADDVPLLPLMGENPIPDAAQEKLRVKVLKIIAKTPLQLFKDAGRGGRPRGGTSAGRRALTAEERTEAARQTLREILSSLGALISSTQARIIPLEDRQMAATTLKDYARELLEG
ncbi:MAG: hypothetical protein PHG74_09170 [Kiritimatiellae bacterium]|nr:hypothetical protein [Kiritimatiellia bacterium]MDD3584172.1 hypothetical protein [Kiritimatiellia bacterium]